MKEILPLTPTLHHLRTYPLPQSDRGPFGPIQGQPPENLLKVRKDWPIPPTPLPTPAPTIKTKAPPHVTAFSHAMVRPRQAVEDCSWRLHCQMCKKDEECKEDWDCDMQKEQPRMCPQNNQHPQPQSTQCPQPQNMQQPQAQDTQCPQPQNAQHPQSQLCPKPQNNQNSQSSDVPDRYAKRIRLRREWEERIKRLNKKHNLDYYSSSESDSDSHPEPDHIYEHKYETLI